VQHINRWLARLTIAQKLIFSNMVLALPLAILLADRIATQRRSQSGIIFLTLFFVVLAAFVMVIMIRSITKPLNRILSLAADIAEGRVKEAFSRLNSGEFQEFMEGDGRAGDSLTRDETAKLIRSVCVMIGNLNGLLSKVMGACTQVAGCATQMTECVGQVEAAISKQAASTNDVSATSKEIYATVQELARTMNSLMKMATDAAKTASGGVNNLNGIRFAIDELIDSSSALIGSFESINQKTAAIDKVITTITRVANSTNLLSLNAAIQAEKAGEKAGGFSVVALEIRRLADQTAVAALDIERQIREMQQAVRDGVSKVESNAQQTQASSSAINELSVELGQVIEGTAMLEPQFEAVNSGMQMQSQGAGQIAESMINLRDAASQTRLALEEFRAVAYILSDSVTELQGEVGRFSVAS
jgi:methyl-accepting chemotaxis protein WspA